MSISTAFDYYYGDESSQFSFYRIPRQLVTGQQFKKISTDAKLLYGLLLDRMGLSARNSWYDDAGRVYIFYTLDEIQEDLNCGHEKAVKLLSELDTDKGCGLIERMKQGQGKPTKIYVKRFTTRQVTAETIVPQEVPRLPKIGSQEVGKSEVKSSEKPKSRLPIIRSADFGKSDGNYTESNQTDFSYKNQSIHPSPSAEQPGWMDRSEYLRELKENIEYPFLCQQFNRDDVDEVVGLMADVMCSTQQTIRIGGNDIPLTQVQARFYRLDYFNYIVGMLYTCAFQSLYYQADKVHQGALPVPVRMMMDEFCNVSLPDDFGKLQATMRSRNIMSTIVLQNISALKALFKDDWEGLIGNADTLLYLGGNEVSTFKYISELLGKETLDTRTRSVSKGRNGSASVNYQQTGRELMTPDEVRALDNDRCILFIRGELPVMDRKYDILKHPDLKLTEDGGAAPYVHCPGLDYALEDFPLSTERWESIEIIE